jgi:hypothetical protein
MSNKLSFYNSTSFLTKQGGFITVVTQKKNPDRGCGKFWRGVENDPGGCGHYLLKETAFWTLKDTFRKNPIMKAFKCNNTNN